MPPHHVESEVESFLEGSHGDRTHIKRADHHTVTPLCGTLLRAALSPRGRLTPVRQNKNPLCHPMFKHLTKSGTQIVSFEFFSEDTPVPEGASASLGKADESQIIISINSDSVI